MNKKRQRKILQFIAMALVIVTMAGIVWSGVATATEPDEEETNESTEICEYKDTEDVIWVLEDETWNPTFSEETDCNIIFQLINIPDNFSQTTVSAQLVDMDNKSVQVLTFESVFGYTTAINTDSSNLVLWPSDTCWQDDNGDAYAVEDNDTIYYIDSANSTLVFPEDGEFMTEELTSIIQLDFTRCDCDTVVQPSVVFRMPAIDYPADLIELALDNLIESDNLENTLIDTVDSLEGNDDEAPLATSVSNESSTDQAAEQDSNTAETEVTDVIADYESPTDTDETDEEEEEDEEDGFFKTLLKENYILLILIAVTGVAYIVVHYKNKTKKEKERELDENDEKKLD